MPSKSLEDRLAEDSFEPTEEDLPMVYGSRVIADRSLVPDLGTVYDNVMVNLAGSDESIIQVLKDNHVMDPATLKERTPFFWPTEITSSRLDSYDTRMDPETSLPNYAEDATDGVSFCDSHTHTEQAFGRSFAGLYVNSDQPATAPMGEDPPNPPTVYAAWYTFPDLKLNRVNTNDLIFGIRSGLVKDISIGFKPGPGFMYRCSVCGQNMWSWDCSHVPGEVEPVVVDEASGRTEDRYAFAWVVGARLSEGSAVFDGATPRAMIIKAMREARIGRLPEKTLRMVESMTRVQLPRKRALLSGTSESKEKDMGTENKDKDLETRAQQSEGQVKSFMRVLKTTLSKRKIEFDDDTITAEDGLRLLNTHIEDLTERAQRGDKMFDVHVANALAEGERAQGDKFDKAKWERRLRNMDPEDVSEMTAGWKETADALLGGGRHSKDGGSDKEGGEESDDSTRKPKDQPAGEAYEDEYSYSGV